ncbi:hypothetical protein [Aquabacter spiritensis]|uniref:Uncharacterized protein n=1 Tax=Aquabacter spiritensis TaxID=933073 RepID=A0A4R3LLB2_9HYPH|nr:hypothetical protein [Aquabacter spiritensis]TCT01082.1 hypothetical protein EDC64_11952 [Aquabacter spiritensis]
MSWTITNRQLDPMTFTQENGISSTANGGEAVVVAVGVARVTYHKLNYKRFGIWPFPDGQALNATYGGGQNIYITNPTSAVDCVFQYAPSEEAEAPTRRSRGSETARR